MGKPVLLVLHPKQWANSEYGKNSCFDIHHVSIGGVAPSKKNGTPTYDGYAEVVTQEGVEDLVRTAEKLQPTFFLYWLHSGLINTHLQGVRDVSPKTKFLFWFGNHRIHVAGNVIKFAKFVDALYLNSTEPTQFSLYHNYGIKRVGTLWDGFEPDEVPLVETEPQYDCFFAGESYKAAAERNEVFSFPGTHIRREFILRAGKRFNMAVHASRNESWPFPTLPAVYHPHHTVAMRNAKITLNLNHFPSFRHAYTRRTIRSIFARRCHITLYIPGMEDHFENHKHLVWFHKINEGINLIEHYLKDDEAREKIAWEGWKHACRHFTFRHRLDGFSRDMRKWFPGEFK